MATEAGGKAEQAGDSRSLEVLARVGLVAYGVVYLLIGWLAVQLAWGVGASKSADPSGAMRTLADQPLGKFLLWLVAVGLVALALWQASEAIWGYRNRDAVRRVVKGMKKSFSEEIDTSSMSPVARQGVERLGQVGYIGKGVALGVVGGLLSYAVLTFDRQKAPGLDGALQTILAQPYGRFMLTAVVVEFVAFGLFAMLQSRYSRM